MTSVMPVQCSTNWAIKPTGSWSQCGFVIYPQIGEEYKWLSSHLRVYYELTVWSALSWLDSSVGRALQRYHRGHRFESRSGLNFFRPSISQLYITVMINLTNRFHVAVRLFSNRSQMTSKCGKNKKVAHEAIAECVTDVLTTFWRLLWSITESDARQHGIYLFYIITKSLFCF